MICFVIYIVLYIYNKICSIVEIIVSSVSSTHTHHGIHRAIKCLNTISPYLAISLIWILVPRNSQKCVSGSYDIQNVLVLVSMTGLRLIAVNMRYTKGKFTLWTPNCKLQILER